MHRPLTSAGQQAINEIAARYGLSTDAVHAMLQAVVNGGGTMAQFNIPELGGGGQWMQGGMTMVGDMFNYGLQGTVSNLCQELSNLIASQNVFQPQPARPASGSFQQQGGGSFQQQGSGGFGMMGGAWWPSELGQPSSSGAQNNVRYAVFPHCRRLALEINGNVSVFDTLDHQIGGVSQQQAGGSSVTFTSQYGTVDTLNLPLISGAGTQPAPQASVQVPAPQPSAPAQHAQGSGEIFKSIEQLGQLHQNGVLSQQEFETKKAELLSRL
ncbi:MAG: SHOCT domain-containing protein [Opitutales bacterium]